MARPRAIQPISRTENFMKLGIHGEPGVGKSVLAGSSPNALILTHDADEMSSPAEWGSNAHVMLVRNFEELDESYEFLRHEGHSEFEWVWIDNLTLLQEQCMDQVMADLVVSKPHRNRWVPDMHEYLVVQNHLGTQIRNIKALPMHFGWTAHVMSSEDENGKVQYIPMLQGGQGQYSQKMCGYMGVIGYMYVVRKEGKEVRQISFSKRSKFLAKSRFKGLQGVMTNPTMPKMMEAVRSQLPTLGAKPKAASSTRTTGKTAATTRTRRRAS